MDPDISFLKIHAMSQKSMNKKHGSLIPIELPHKSD